MLQDAFTESERASKLRGYLKNRDTSDYDDASFKESFRNRLTGMSDDAKSERGYNDSITNWLRGQTGSLSKLRKYLAKQVLDDPDKLSDDAINTISDIDEAHNRLNTAVNYDSILPALLSGASGLAGGTGAYLGTRALFNKLFGKKDKKSILRILTELGLGGAGGLATAGLVHGIYGGSAGSRRTLTANDISNDFAPWYAQPLTIPSRIVNLADTAGRYLRERVGADPMYATNKQVLKDFKELQRAAAKLDKKKK